MSIHLSSERNTYQRDEVIQFDITFTNLTTHQNGVLLPGTKNKGKRMIFLSYYSVDSTNFYTNVFTESRVIEMDTSALGQTGWANLDPGESITIPIFFGDTKNYSTHNAAHHKIPDLPAGNYQVLAWYDPWDEPMAQYAFKQINPFGRSDDDFSSNRIYIDLQTQSNYFSLTISDSLTPKPQWKPTKFCPTNCNLCHAIDHENWDKLKRTIAKQTDYSNKLERNNMDTAWLQPHRNIAWMSPPPDAILASLPTYTYRSMILKNENGHYYYSATWQLGRTFPVRSRFRNLVHSAIRVYPPAIRDELNYRKLTHFAPY